MKPCFQINSKKLEKELLFRDEEDYIYGMNTIALILLQFPTVVVTMPLFFARANPTCFWQGSARGRAKPS